VAEVAWRPARASDLKALYPVKPFETVRALVITVDGEPCGIIGLAKEPQCDRAFSEYRPALEPYLKRMAVLRAILAFMQWVKTNPVQVYALSEGTGILERLGFTHVTENFFVWRG
jgi:hypothetical protein